MRARPLLAAGLLAVGPALGPQDAPEPAAARVVVVGSKNFTESSLLGEMLTLLLREHTDLAARHEPGLGGTLVCMTALETGEIDLYPDYTGTGWAIVLKEPEPISDPLRAFTHVQRRYRELYDVEWLPPFGFENSYALAVRAELARELGLETVSDLAQHADELRAGFSIEFMNREDGWPGLAAAYGLELEGVRAMEHGLAYEAIQAGAIDLIDAYTTDGKLLRFDLTLLTDDRRFFPPYHAAPIVRGELLREHPAARAALERVAWRLDARRMMELNHAVEVEGRDFRAVARDFLEQEGLLAPRAARERGGAALGGTAARLPRLVLEHLQLTAIAVLLAALVAIPLGIWTVRHPLPRRVCLALTGVVQTIPSLALLAFLIAVPGMGLSVRSAILALFLYALLPILRNTIAGLDDVDPDLVDAAEGMGLTPRQVLLRIRLPLATRTIMAGIRTSTVIAIGIATLAAFIGAGGLGEPIVTGLYTNDTTQILWGAVPAALLALAADALLAQLERLVVPRGLRLAEQRG